MIELLTVGKLTIEQLRRLLLGYRTTEKTCKVLGDAGKGSSGPKQRKKPDKGHGRNGAAEYVGAPRVTVEHPTLKPGESCPYCPKGKVYPLKEPS